jgi:hypothetical protein
LGSGEVVEGEVVLEGLAHFDDVFLCGSFACRADLAEELGEFLLFGVDSGDWKARFSKSVA